MATIDIRTVKPNDIECIMFGDCDSLQRIGNGIIVIKDEYNETSTNIRNSDIGNLIKALQKAQELWGDE